MLRMPAECSARILVIQQCLYSLDGDIVHPASAEYLTMELHSIVLPPVCTHITSTLQPLPNGGWVRLWPLSCDSRGHLPQIIIDQEKLHAHIDISCLLVLVTGELKRTHVRTV